MRGREADLERGLAALTRLTDGPVFLCTGDRFSLPVAAVDKVRHERFAGPHPAGTVGLHIHTLDPVDRARMVWHIGYQDTLAIGRLFEQGAIDVTWVVSLAGPGVARPRLVQARIGMATGELTAGELVDGEVRVVSGSVLSGRTAAGSVLGYLGRFHRQVSALPEWHQRELLGWAGAGVNRYSTIRSFVSRLWPGRRFAMTTALHGSPRAIVPIGLYERVMPFDLPATFLLKALLTHDVERAEELGCLELDEEASRCARSSVPPRTSTGRIFASCFPRWRRKADAAAHTRPERPSLRERRQARAPPRAVRHGRHVSVHALVHHHGTIACARRHRHEAHHVAGGRRARRADRDGVLQHRLPGEPGDPGGCASRSIPGRPG